VGRITDMVVSPHIYQYSDAQRDGLHWFFRLSDDSRHEPIYAHCHYEQVKSKEEARSLSGGVT